MTQTPPQPLRVVAVSGTLSSPSKTDALVDAVLDELALVLPIERHVIRVSELGPLFAGALTRDQLDERVERELRAVEGADLLIAASPVYRASFTGLFKHFFDFVEQYALVDVPVLLAATGGSERHALILEHSLRPLFGFFQALTLPLGVYAHASDFTDRRVTAPLLQERIRAAIARGLPLIRSSVDEKRRIERAVSGVGDELDALPTPTAQDAAPVRLYS
ncbi:MULTISPECIES: FMN reductase [unclassified Frigoribacterium]|jgi:FMN reductase|uniref:FMN reductase n=1 Tax=unclassified Frigoribacterium TaxID=2627005 RepID=UPI0017815A67|nr:MULTISPECIES: FMN reductase [unclassified Frigoribacterium]MBD8610452.1 FMN reductase [Frigoribacterium sp. CFBP 13729]MBF4580102.1 FMN reductase [Frigoribacterium sp. VKM Ac-2530]